MWHIVIRIVTLRENLFTIGMLMFLLHFVTWNWILLALIISYFMILWKKFLFRFHILNSYAIFNHLICLLIRNLLVFLSVHKTQTHEETAFFLTVSYKIWNRNNQLIQVIKLLNFDSIIWRVLRKRIWMENGMNI